MSTIARVQRPVAARSFTRTPVATPAAIEDRSASRILLFLFFVQVISAYLTETKFVSGIAYNVGAFEFMSVIFLPCTLFYVSKNHLPIRLHPISGLLLALIPIATISIVQVSESIRFTNCVLSVIILCFLFMFTFFTYNFLASSEKNVRFFVRIFAYSAFLISLWVVYDSIGHGGKITAVGPFRNRAHAGIYMFTSVWAVIINIVWPGTKRLQRWIFCAMLPTIFYCVSASGRRSIYFTLFLGFVFLAMVLFFTKAKDRSKVIGPLVVLPIAFIVLYTVLSPTWSTAAFFRDRVGMVGGRLRMATASADDPEEMDNFLAMQRRGGIRAFMENPVFGIGWGGFYQSKYSPTGHEMHSTPFRFLAELGIMGTSVYVIYLYRLVFGAFLLWRRSVGSKYELVALILQIAVACACISSYHNRQITERTFWLLLTLFMSFETLFDTKLKPQELAAKQAPKPA